jgi:NADH:ubiquinone oxidoreductase subunit 5 (subunit L)/multisubunit Na+/H+ antiporter MnhA subunit
MLILVTADNFVQMFVGWEGVGLCSYLLINFWFTRIQASKAALKAMLVNRIGDFFLILSIFLVYVTFDTLDFYITEIGCGIAGFTYDQIGPLFKEFKHLRLRT